MNHRAEHIASRRQIEDRETVADLACVQQRLLVEGAIEMDIRRRQRGPRFSQRRLDLGGRQQHRAHLLAYRRPLRRQPVIELLDTTPVEALVIGFYAGLGLKARALAYSTTVLRRMNRAAGAIMAATGVAILSNR